METERLSDHYRELIRTQESQSQRTFTPSMAVIWKSAGIYHWTADWRQLIDYTSGVLVANLGHNPVEIHNRMSKILGWDNAEIVNGFRKSAPLTAYNAISMVEGKATSYLTAFCQTHRGGVRLNRRGGARLQKVLWAASGAEAIQKAIWASMALDKSRPMILATRHGYHGKKGLSCAVTGSESDPERDPRVRFIGFPMQECRDLAMRNNPFDLSPYQRELESLWQEHGNRIGTLITEPYLGGGGSYHPPATYLQLLQNFCRDHAINFILDEVQSNFGRTGEMFAFEKYGLEPDLVVLGKGLGNGVPVDAVIGRADILDSLTYGEASDTWSANPLSCAAVAATLEEFESRDVLGPMGEVSAIIEAGLVKLKEHPCVAHVRGELGGMVWGIEFVSPEAANAFVLEAYRGGVHLLGPLAKKVVRIAPPLVITEAEAKEAGKILCDACARVS